MLGKTSRRHSGHGSPDERDAARVTGESAPAGSASRRGPRPLGAGRSGGVDGSHADGAGERRQRRRMVWPNAYFAEQGLWRKKGTFYFCVKVECPLFLPVPFSCLFLPQPGDGPCSGSSVRSAVNHQLESRMREIRTYGSAGGETGSTGLRYPDRARGEAAGTVSTAGHISKSASPSKNRPVTGRAGRWGGLRCGNR